MGRDKLADDFLKAQPEVEKILSAMLFTSSPVFEEGFSCSIQYRREDTVVEFQYGPPEYHIDMVIYSLKGKFMFRDLMQISTISDWVGKNRYQNAGRRIIKDELLWFVELLKISLPLIE